MAANSMDLFGKATRSKPRVLMHFTDVGCGAADELLATFSCRKCGHESGWMICANETEVKRGLPCPVCNPATNPVIAGIDRRTSGAIGQP